jgi:hypothetical protein
MIPLNKRKKIFFSVVVIIAAFFIYSLLFGKLFPFSPLVIGFDKHEQEHVVVYTEKGAAYTGFNEIDSFVPLVENFHSLIFKKKPRVFLFGNKKTYAHRSLSKARFCAYYNGDIVVSPWAQQEAQDGLISMEIYLRHELSHSLLQQHAGLWNTIKYPKWLLEGIAVYSVNQMGTSWYPGKDETCEYIRQGNFIHPKQFKTKSEDHVKLDVKNRIPFMYSEFACIVDYLITSFGRDRFQQYMMLLVEGKNHDTVFKQVFQIDFEEFIINFKGQVMSSSKDDTTIPASVTGK